jgi:hypothetical protein
MVADGRPAAFLVSRKSLDGLTQRVSDGFSAGLRVGEMRNPALDAGWRAREDLNLRPLAPQANALSAELRAHAQADYSTALLPRWRHMIQAGGRGNFPFPRVRF